MSTKNFHVDLGEIEKFTTTSKTKPKQFENLLNNTIMSRYKQDKIKSYNYKTKNKTSDEFKRF